MKNFTPTNRPKSSLKMLLLFLFVGLVPTLTNAQNYRTIDAYMDDFGKNELFLKKTFMDYTATIVESQLYSRTQTTVVRIVEKLEKLNNILKIRDKGFEGNTMLRDSFIKMNEKTIECLTNGTLILTDYDTQSALSLPEIGENLTHKEIQLMAYFDALRQYDNDKKQFASCYKLHFKGVKGKNILEYNAKQNVLFYKLNVIDEKLSAVVAAKDTKGFADCTNMIELMNQEVMAKTTQLNGYFADNTLNAANVEYSKFIASQKAKINTLFTDYVAEYNKVQSLKSGAQSGSSESITAYNNAVDSFNTKKNLFYAVFNEVQSQKKVLYDKWFTVNSAFLKNNGKFVNIYDKYAFNN